MTTVDPQAQRLLDQMAKQNAQAPHFDDAPTEADRIAATRKNYREVIELAGPPESVARVVDLAIHRADGSVPVRLYEPSTDKVRRPVLLWFHGGGFVSGGLDTHDRPLRSLANRLGFPVISVAWRLAPEYPYPAGIEDAYAALQWAAQGIVPHFNFDTARIVVGGDSAGGTIAAVLSHLARDRGGPRITFQTLLYPNTDLSADGSKYPSWRENDGRILTRSDSEKNFAVYAGSTSRECPTLSPINAKDFSNLPNALVVTGEADPQRDEGEAYAKKLLDAGVAVELIRYPGMIHGFFQMAGALDAGRDLISRLATSIQKATR